MKKLKKKSTVEKEKIQKKFDQSHTKSLIFTWCMDGGAVNGRRMSRVEFAEYLGLDYKKLGDIIGVVENELSAMVTSKKDFQTFVYKFMAKSVSQMDSDRSRAVAHADILEKKLSDIMKEIELAKVIPDKTPAERNAKSRLITSLMSNFKSISYQKMESIRLLYECTDRINGFFQLFSGRNKTGFDGIVEPPKDPASRNDDQILNHKTAVQLLDAKLDPILPRQVVLPVGPRNPSEGFESFADPEEEV